MLGPAADPLRHARRRRSASCRRSSPASTSGARAIPSPTPAPTSRRCAPRRCSTATTTSSTARRSGPRSPPTPTGSSCWCAPTSRPRSRRASPSCWWTWTDARHHRAADHQPRAARRVLRGVLRQRPRAEGEPGRPAQQGLGPWRRRCSASSASSSARRAVRLRARRACKLLAERMGVWDEPDFQDRYARLAARPRGSEGALRHLSWRS